MEGAFKEDACRLPRVLRDHGVRTPGAFDPHATRLLLRDVMVRAARKLASPDRFRDELIPADVNVLLANRSVAGISDDFFSWWMIVGNNIVLDVEDPDWHLMADHCAAHPNLIGLLYVAHEGDSVSGFINAFILLRTETSLTRAFLLLRAHQLREKEWPGQLSDALPANSPPDAVLDYFSNQLLRYSRERGLLWSVGPDGTDNDGDPAKDMVLDLTNPVKISKPQP